MKQIAILIAVIALLSSCNQSHNDHKQASSGHSHGDVKNLFTTYNNSFEVFAEADPFLIGKRSTILVNLSYLPSFKPIKQGRVKAYIEVKGKKVMQTKEEPYKNGVYRFKLKPNTKGKGKLVFEITQGDHISNIAVQNIEVYDNEHLAYHAAEDNEPHAVNATVFTKEQSWKIDFASVKPQLGNFGQVIKTVAQVQPAIGDEVLLTAKTNGIVLLPSINLFTGKKLNKGDKLFSISSEGLADNNMEVKFAEARNNFQKAEQNYNRAKELYKEKIVSEKDFLMAKSEYDNAKLVYDNLNNNFSSSGQSTRSPLTGFVKEIYVQNGQYVVSGQKIMRVHENKNLILKADVQQKYAPFLPSIVSANIRIDQGQSSISLEELNGKILSYGKTTNRDNFLVPINIQIENNGNIYPGSFVEVFLKGTTNNNKLSIPNTALLENQGSFFVYVQITPEYFEKRKVIIGVTDGIRTEITSGIDTNERIVSKGAIFIKLAEATGNLDPHSGHAH